MTNEEILKDNAKFTDDWLARLIYEGLEDHMKQINHDINKAVFDLAEEMDVSVYDVCCKYRPTISCVKTNSNDFSKIEVDYYLEPIKMIQKE